MDTTFISIHNLEENATILYTSDSIIDILGYTPDEVVNRPAWDFFPKEELPYAQQFHQKRVTMDKAAVLVYCRVRHKDGEWVGCECCFSIVYDVMIVCTSIYRRGLGSEQRALEAPIVRRMFSSSPQDPRYHMLTHLSHKFTQPAAKQQHEPRAALFLNRFTRTLSIMYATAGVAEVIGIPAAQMAGRSFYYCIAENCLQDAVKCLEQAKANDSIAYLRFWFRDPRIDDNPPPPDPDSDDEMTNTSIDDEEGGIGLRSTTRSTDSTMSDAPSNDHPSRQSSSNESTHTSDTHQAIFGSSQPARSSASSSPETNPLPIELEAVISCASDGLVVCLRRARPIIPPPTSRPSRPVHANGLFAAPWAPEPILPRLDARAGAGTANGFAPSLGPRGARGNLVEVGRGMESDFMGAIREQAVFAWALTKINGAIASYGRGRPRGESLPVEGVRVWESERGLMEGGSGGGEGYWREDSGVGNGGQQTRENGFVSGGGMANGGQHNDWYRDGTGSSSSRSPGDNGGSGRIFGDPGLDSRGANGRGNGGYGGMR